MQEIQKAVCNSCGTTIVAKLSYTVYIMICKLKPTST
jgi:hypothetical protein